MKHFFLFFQLLLATGLSAQHANPDLLYGGQLRVILPGISPYLELPIAGDLVLHTELSANFGYAMTTFGGRNEGIGVPLSGTVAPRWYYNYGRRLAREKPVYRNSANFLSLRATYLPGILVVKSTSALYARSGFTIIPTYGLRRPVGKLVFEASAGVGFRRTGPENGAKSSGGALDLALGIGF
ncbi:hypothetical protein [Lewinella sp. IMCC34183]|uniref:hypothetical protein n=1 Tax=Lewinella sp. IMCC34183 TaxID=2248762 RepID=UPI000E2641C0|nr:hypothetical protein [Lewinella sp. IMCC34183]